MTREVLDVEDWVRKWQRDANSASNSHRVSESSLENQLHPMLRLQLHPILFPQFKHR